VRNPYRILVDQNRNDWLFWGDVGPDADEASVLGPIGADEVNLAKQAGNYGWPYFLGTDNTAYQISYANPPYYNDASSPQNISTWNTGLTNLPPAEPALLQLSNTAIFSGPSYYFDSTLTDLQRFPADFDGIYFYYDFNRSWIWVVTLDANGNIVSNDRFAPSAIILPYTQVTMQPISHSIHRLMVIDADITATDVEDGTIACVDINVLPALGHIGHFHNGASVDGCPKTLRIDPVAHETDQDIFYVLNADYTDSGGLQYYVGFI